MKRWDAPRLEAMRRRGKSSRAELFSKTDQTGLSASVGIGLLAGAFEGDLIVRDLSAFLHRGGLGGAIGLHFVSSGRHWLPGINCVRAMDWGDHSGLLSQPYRRDPAQL
jgi:hypothetical protein